MYTISDPAEVERVFCIPAAEVSKIDSAASLIHMMNQNIFSSGAYRLVSETDAAALADSINKTFQARHWMCGFPDKLIVASVGDYLVSAFGNEDLIDAFAKCLSEAYPSAKVLVNEPFQG
ncbi:MAG TPA: hypothetical protein DER68_00390 [Ruminococcaceae bacterium]|nr:hypothetical protein [Oscillospiraceae bacterium]